MNNTAYLVKKRGRPTLNEIKTKQIMYQNRHNFPVSDGPIEQSIVELRNTVQRQALELDMIKRAIYEIGIGFSHIK